MQVLEEPPECLQCLPTEQKTSFCAQKDLRETQLFVEIERVVPKEKNNTTSVSQVL